MSGGSCGRYNPGDAIPDSSPAPSARHRAPPRHGSRDPAGPRAVRAARCSSAPAKACAARSAPCRATTRCPSTRSCKECAEVESLGIGGIILFGLPETKDEMASGAYDDQGIVQRAVRAIKRECRSCWS